MEEKMIRANLLATLDCMANKAKDMNVQGVAVASFLDSGNEIDWIGEMKVCGTPYKLKEGWNLVAIAWSKAGEVMATSANSGDPNHEKIVGELGFTGGAYDEIDGCKLAFAFSGATSEEDLEIAQYGIVDFKNRLKE